MYTCRLLPLVEYGKGKCNTISKFPIKTLRHYAFNIHHLQQKFIVHFFQSVQSQRKDFRARILIHSFVRTIRDDGYIILVSKMYL